MSAKEAMKYVDENTIGVFVYVSPFPISCRHQGMIIHRV